MQPMNVSPLFLSQGSEINTKDGNLSAEGTNVDEGFSSLVEQHLNEHNSDNTKPSTEVKESEHAASSANKEANSGKEELSKSERQENTQIAAENKTHSKAEQAKSSESSKFDEQDKLAEATANDSSADKEALKESEQFISLLYNSDNTLAAESKNASDGKNENKATSDAMASVIDKTSQSDKETANNKEHKLAAFSQDELQKSMQLNRHQDLTPQASDKVINELQKPLNKMLVTAAQEKLMATGSSNNEALTDEKTELTSDETPLKDKASQNVGHKNNKAVSAELAKEVINQKDLVDKAGSKPTEDKAIVSGLANAKEQIDRTLDKKLTVSADKVETKLDNSLLELTDEAQLSQSDSEESSDKKGSSAKELISNAQSASATESSNSALSTEGSIKVNDVTKLSEAGKVVEASNLSSHRNEQKQVTENANVKDILQQTRSSAADKLQVNPQELAAKQATEEVKQVDDVSLEDNVYSESFDELSQENAVKTKGDGITANNNASSAVRNINDPQNPFLQASQVKQSNDAYMEYQVSEALNHSIASDSVQIQKSNVLLQQETISIFRKDFTDAVKEKVMLMINQKTQQLEITLDPPEFGNMQVRVNLQGEQAAVNFVVQNQQAKEALEQNMHKLKEMLAEQGVDVGGANVEQNDQQAEQSASGETTSKNQGQLANSEESDDVIQHVLSADLFNNSASGVDYYA